MVCGGPLGRQPVGWDHSGTPPAVTNCLQCSGKHMTYTRHRDRTLHCGAGSVEQFAAFVVSGQQKGAMLRALRHPDGGQRREARGLRMHSSRLTAAACCPLQQPPKSHHRDVMTIIRMSVCPGLCCQQLLHAGAAHGVRQALHITTQRCVEQPPRYNNVGWCVLNLETLITYQLGRVAAETSKFTAVILDSVSLAGPRRHITCQGALL